MSKQNNLTIKKIVDSIVNGTWVCPKCNGKPPLKRLCNTCMFMTNEQGKKISMKTMVELGYGGK